MTEPFRYKPRREKLHVDDPGLLEMITKLASHLGLSKGHMAEILGVGRTTFYDFLNDNEVAMDAYSSGRAMGRLDFAQTGMLHARSDPATWRHLSKHKRFLGLDDAPKAAKVVEDNPAAGGAAKRLSREELMGRILELSRKTLVEDVEEVRREANHGTTGRGIVKR